MTKRETPSNTYSFDDLAKATRRRLGPTRLVLGDDVEVELPSVFRLAEKTREKIYKLLRELDSIGEDADTDDEKYQLLYTQTADILLLATPEAQKILDLVEDSSDEDWLLAASLLGEVLSKWMENTQVGEA
jgi:hypothetical protein